jgi:hypothetical protein
MNREFLCRALAVLGQVRPTDHFNFDLEDDIRAELAKPEPVECGEVEVIQGYPFGLLRNMLQILPDGKYRLLAERIDDA